MRADQVVTRRESVYAVATAIVDASPPVQVTRTRRTGRGWGSSLTVVPVIVPVAAAGERVSRTWARAVADASSASDIANARQLHRRITGSPRRSGFPCAAPP